MKTHLKPSSTLALLLLALGLTQGCGRSSGRADFIIYNARVYTLDSGFGVCEAFAVKDGRILQTGTSAEILEKYPGIQEYDLGGKFVYPGFMDAHCHFYGLGEGLVRWADLRGAASMEEVIDRLKAFHEQFPQLWLLGRGWDQNRFPDKQFPDNELLDKHFPDIPVFLVRIDGHAALANTMALDMAGMDTARKIEGGEALIRQGKLTGLLIDNAKEMVSEILPALEDSLKIKALLKAQETCFSKGLTRICDAGLPASMIHLIRNAQENGQLKIPMVVMLNPDEESLSAILDRGILKTDRLLVNSVKLYADGALGSRGALLLEPYSDAPGEYGLRVIHPEEFRRVCQRAEQAGFQVCTHAIGDSANRYVLEIYAEFLKPGNDKRWRIEHAQVVDSGDLQRFGENGIIPSVQPTHATSDMYWAAERLGPGRLRQAYAYKDLLNQNGWMPLGTDFPIEEVSPLLTFYAAIFRKDMSGWPEDGFQTENSLNRREALYGMTLWAAKASFLENETGSLEPGKWADFVVLDTDLMVADPDAIRIASVLQTWVMGENVYQQTR